MIELANGQKQESSSLIYDTALRSKFYGFTPLQLLAFILGYQPWAVGIGKVVTDDGMTVGFIDNEWIRDSHAVLVKQRNKMNKRTTREVVKILVGYLTDGQIETILHQLVKRTEGVEEKNDEQEGILIKQIASIQSKNEDGKFNNKKRSEILHLWFKNIVIGPYIITRSLSTFNINKYDTIQGPLITIIRNTMGIDLFNMTLDHITLLDDRFYLIPGADAKAMDWPHDIMYDFIGISGETQKTEERETKILKKFKSRVAEGMDEDMDTEYYVAMESNEGGIYLRLYYGTDVFGMANYFLTDIFNSEDFNNWLKSPEINWDLWCGRGEKDKMEDHRNLQIMYQQLLKENNKLQEKLARYEKDENDEEE